MIPSSNDIPREQRPSEHGHHAEGATKPGRQPQDHQVGNDRKGESATIDPLNEQLVHPCEAARLLGRRSDGRHPHVSMVYRLMSRGSHGVVLESIRTPRLMTSREAVGRYLTRLQAAMTGGPIEPPSASCKPAKTRMPSIDRELDRLRI